MGRWVIEARGWQHILTHYCDHARSGDRNDQLSQDLGGGYVRCEKCSDKFLPTHEPGNPRFLLRLRTNEDAPPIAR